MNAKQARLAVLIDADNARAALADALFAEIAKYGSATTRRIYGDWTLPNLKSWKDVLARHAIQPMQQFRNTVGKNATDSAMIIDAMDLLHTDRFDGFCIVSSDSDFTRLASRIRESGLTVYGIGEDKTPKAFKSACDRFITTEVLERTEADEPAAPKRDLKADKALLKLVRDAVDAASDEDGWAQLGAVGSHIARQEPEFDTRNYGYRKLRDLAIALNTFETEERGDGSRKTLYLRDRRRKNG